mgnify:CR=1 FL=1
MRYKLYTLVDITNTNQYRPDHGRDALRWKEQNFNTVLQTIGLRASINYFNRPDIIEVKGSLIGFNTDDLIRVWRFDFETDREDLFQKDDDPIGFLKDDFHLVPYIQGLDELMEQKYAVFVSHGDGKNIVFHKKQ